MNEHKSDTLEQRKKAQQEFLKLKRMQSGEIEPEKADEEVIPLTFNEKIKNFWYHYKTHTILTVFLTVAISLCVHQCATRPHYDAEIILYSNNFYSVDQVNLLTDYMSQFFEDTNGDGEINIVISDCSYTTDGTYDSNRTNTLATKLNATIASGVETQLYIVDEKNLKQLDKLAENYGGFIIDSAPMPQAILEFKDPNGFTFPEGLIIGKRVIKGTTMEDKPAAIQASEYATKVLEKIKNAQ